MSHARKRRSFTTELLVWILLFVVIPVMGFQIYSYFSSFDHLERLEREKALATSRSAAKAIENLGESILGITVTNAYWEVNREAIEKRDIQWLKENVADMPDIVPNIDFVAEADLNGNILVQAGGVKEFQNKVAYPVIMDRFTAVGQFFGILNTSRGLAAVAVAPVTNEERTKPPLGMLITGRLLTGDILKSLSAMLQADLSILTDAGQSISSPNGFNRSELMPLYSQFVRGGGGESFDMARDGGTYRMRYAAPLRDMAGGIVGILHIQYASVSASQTADDQRTLMIYVAAILTLLVTLVIYLLRRRIVLPLRQFTQSLQEVAAGKQIDEIPKHVLQAEAEIVRAFQQIIQWNRLLEQTVERRTAEIRSLLDHARQGFLSFGPDLRVKDEFSAECVRLFGREPAGLAIQNLLYPDDPEENRLLRSILTDYYGERTPLAKELIFSLLPNEVKIGNRTAKIEFVPLQDGRGDDGAAAHSIMAILTDLTETRQLEDRMQQERRILKMVVQSVTHPEDFAHVLRDFESFRTTEIWERTAPDESPQEKAASLYRTVHTFKGSFSFLQFLHIVPQLHGLESGLQERMGDPGLTFEALYGYLREQGLEKWLEADLEQLRSVLGPSYPSLLSEEGVKLDRRQWNEIEAVLDRTLISPEDREWLQEFRRWRFRPASTLFRPYAAYLEDLAARTGVRLHPVELRGDDVPVDPDRLYGFARAFVHVVRNAVVHGIEPPEERIACGKEEYGTVSFAIERTPDDLRILFGDDGRGIDPESLRAQGAKRGISTDHLTDEEALRLIFEERMSTAREVSEWSGRGVGLSVVKDEVDRLGGNIEIRTAKGSGTVFIFRIPNDTEKGADRIGA
ncbi:hypothetical protein GE107_03370 [Cohnella sp. CFH 77786]|uniref:ATP-binding protein n=1 Tax=Cohnella sp. CFH 77786 TaxID=2662265 RepID=UPI001C60F00E|nr:ATP-binding protein [Cohnella sp. CFH 77786]MBW5445104.1 hypothetical protein [Cohnella sp. CFH 77786]